MSASFPDMYRVEVEVMLLKNFSITLRDCRKNNIRHAKVTITLAILKGERWVPMLNIIIDPKYVDDWKARPALWTVAFDKSV